MSSSYKHNEAKQIELETRYLRLEKGEAILTDIETQNGHEPHLRTYIEFA